MSGTASRLRRCSTTTLAYPSVTLLTSEYNIGTGWHVITCLPTGDPQASLLFLFYAPEFSPGPFITGPTLPVAPSLAFEFWLPAPSVLTVVGQLLYGGQFVSYTNPIVSTLVQPP
jgi:hypothetical protein